MGKLEGLVHDAVRVRVGRGTGLDVGQAGSVVGVQLAICETAEGLGVRRERSRQLLLLSWGSGKLCRHNGCE